MRSARALPGHSRSLGSPTQGFKAKVLGFRVGWSCLFDLFLEGVGGVTSFFGWQGAWN